MYKFKNGRLQGTIKQYDFKNKTELEQHYQDLLHLKDAVNKDLKRIKRVLGDY